MKIHTVHVINDTPPPPSSPGGGSTSSEIQFYVNGSTDNGSLIGINHETGNVHIALRVKSHDALLAVVRELQTELLALKTASATDNAPCFLHITSKMLNPE